jgi:hypothetical protein
MILISDSSVLIDLERGNLLEIAFGSGLEMAVPDLLYERELAGGNGEALKALGLQVIGLEPDEVTYAQQTQRQLPRLSLPDCFALSYARRPGHALLTGDQDLRAFAEGVGVECHGVLWLLDELLTIGAATRQRLHGALDAISRHPRCRLPRPEVRRRLDAWKK